jgi:hypothetical protein
MRAPTARVTFLLVFTFIASIAWPNDKIPKTYPEHGAVVATRLDSYSATLPVRTNPYGGPYGRVQGGNSVRRHIPVARIETETMIYELEGKPAMSVGSAVAFRIEKDRAFVSLENGKEQKYLIVGTELKASGRQ